MNIRRAVLSSTFAAAFFVSLMGGFTCEAIANQRDDLAAGFLAVLAAVIATLAAWLNVQWRMNKEDRDRQASDAATRHQGYITIFIDLSKYQAALVNFYQKTSYRRARVIGVTASNDAVMPAPPRRIADTSIISALDQEDSFALFKFVEYANIKILHASIYNKEAAFGRIMAMEDLSSAQLILDSDKFLASIAGKIGWQYEGFHEDFMNELVDLVTPSDQAGDEIELPLGR